MTAAIWAIVVLGAGNLAQVAERWHLVNKAAELADQFTRQHGDRIRVVAPPKPATENAGAAKPGNVADLTGARKTG